MASKNVVVSIIIPAYNAMPHLATALDSVLNQSRSLDDVEVIVVDDGSTDDTLDTAKRYQTLHPSLFSVMALPEASSSPSKPRNIALQEAKGKYVFFLDADDWLAPRAIELMIKHAEEWDSDVLLVRLVGEGGRDVPQSMFFANQPLVDVFDSNVMWTFGPMKLFRRNLLVQNQIEFPDYMPEDIMFTLRAYLAAKTVSIASDYEYYHYLLFDKDKQCSFSTWEDLESNYRALVDIFEVVSKSKLQGHDPIVLLRRMFRRDVSNMLLSACKQGNKDAFEKICSLVGPYYSSRVARSMPLPRRIILDVSLAWGFDSALMAASLASPEVIKEDIHVCSDGGLGYTHVMGQREYAVSVRDVGGFEAKIISARNCRDAASLVFRGILDLPEWMPYELYTASLIFEETRGAPSFAVQCSITPLPQGSNEADQPHRFEWTSVVDRRLFFSVPHVVVPIKRRDFVGKKRWNCYIELGARAGVVKRLRVATEWNYAVNVERSILESNYGAKGGLFPYRTQYGNVSLVAETNIGVAGFLRKAMRNRL